MFETFTHDVNIKDNLNVQNLKIQQYFSKTYSQKNINLVRMRNVFAFTEKWYGDFSCSKLITHTQFEKQIIGLTYLN